MVRFGACEVICQNCQLFLRHTSNIWDDSKKWVTPLDGFCSHWSVFFNVLTRNTFTPWGSPDEINYRIQVNCIECNRNFNCECGATSFDTNEDYWEIDCCSYQCLVGIKLTSNSIDDILQNTGRLLRGI
jgi:hypothetical protein